MLVSNQELCMELSLLLKKQLQLTVCQAYQQKIYKWIAINHTGNPSLYFKYFIARKFYMEFNFMVSGKTMKLISINWMEIY